MKKHKNGFTLAEVLITLVIIGIIAAMTIPTLMNKTNEQETVVAVKKAYSVLSQAWQRMVAENGELNPSYFGSTLEEATKNFGDMFSKQLIFQKNCEMSYSGDCFSTENGGMYKTFNGGDWTVWNTNTDFYLLRLNDGSALALRAYDTYYNWGTSDLLENSFLTFHVDINGDKGPNTLGKDVFMFYGSKYGIIPSGTPEDTRFDISQCRMTGYGCTAWVVTKGNMDYLRKDISW